MVEFDPRCASTKDVLCRHFYKGLRPSIRLWIDKEGQDLDGWNALIKKAIQAKAKAKIQASASRDLDQQCHQRNQSVHILSAKAQAHLVKDSWVEKPKARALESTIPPQSNSELSTKARREKKKDCRQYDQRQWQQEGSTLAIGVNGTEPSKANKKKNDDQNRNCLGGAARDLS